MMRVAVRTASALFVVAAVTALVMAQPPANTTPVGAIRAKSLLGSTVNLQGGTQVGTVEDMVLNNEGVVDYLIVSENGKLVSVPWDAAKFNWQKRTATINVSPAQFRQVPTFTAPNYPQFYAPAYQTQMYKYYNLRPGQVRRLERRQR